MNTFGHGMMDSIMSAYSTNGFHVYTCFDIDMIYLKFLMEKDKHRAEVTIYYQTLMGMMPSEFRDVLGTLRNQINSQIEKENNSYENTSKNDTTGDYSCLYDGPLQRL